jgi:hypothetical protein
MLRDKLQKALIKDFKVLYQKEFTTDWQAQRFVRELEIGVMGLDNLEALFNSNLKEEREGVIEELDYWAEITDVDKEFADFTHFENGFDSFRIKLHAKLNDLATNTLEVKEICRVCKPRPNGLIPVEDVNDPHCLACGREILSMENIKPNTLEVKEEG